MSVLNTINPTLADLANRMTADGKIDPMIVELLTETNEILEDMRSSKPTASPNTKPPCAPACRPAPGAN